MNTYGDGPTREYVGRNQLDAANADRVEIITTTYENERAILEAHGINAQTAETVCEWAKQTRQQIDKRAMRLILSTRRLIEVSELMDLDRLGKRDATNEGFYDRLNPDDRKALAA